MKATKALLHEQAEQAFAVVWWFRSDPTDPVAKPFYDEVEGKWPGLFVNIVRDAQTMARWEGRLGTLRHLAYGGEREPWDGEGAFDS